MQYMLLFHQPADELERTPDEPALRVQKGMQLPKLYHVAKTSEERP